MDGIESSERRLLIDGDIVAYRCAASAWDWKTGKTLAPLRVAIYRIEDMMDGIFESLHTDRYSMYLSDSTNYRNLIYPQYKANRKGMARPPYLDDCKNFLVQRMFATVCENAEADDYLGIAQCESSNTVICSIDKDLLQIPGSHFNFVKGQRMEVTPMEGLRHFFKQLLIGDTADNIFGIRGIGKVKADRLIDPLDSIEEMLDCVRAVYKDDVRLLMNCDVLWIQQNPNEMFTDRYFNLLKEMGFEEEADIYPIS